MKKTTILLVMALLCLNSVLYAQIKNNKEIPFNIGDRLPETFWQQEHTFYQNGQTISQNLAAYKGKLLILDFWATWCGSCVSKFPLLDSLRQEESELKIVMVNSAKVKDSLPILKAFYANNAYGKAHPLPSIINDTLLCKTFPFRYLPHYIWVDHRGIIIAMTTYHFFNRKSINSLLEQHKLAIKTKNP
ncbi:redoxin family protein [Pedobacter sp. LMG 31464]|uniref:Redoxin family protein n=1 Tax=Pedobacter planticolens TaxID=2679964 RepID=A0A923DVB5_9SPHI|nr:TlpA disulfide reductase family protein [Pedobacter planticolens]MBB2144587.1 redoxin family protein [Pedobacter planticolens]